MVVIYGLALAEYLGLSSLTADEWASIARRHAVPDEALTRTLFADPASTEVPPPAPPREDPWARLVEMNDWSYETGQADW